MTPTDPTSAGPSGPDAAPVDRESGLLPDTTADERDLVTRTPDEWYDSERPPHHE